jgi:AmmeMemoRadiSam system protein A
MSAPAKLTSDEEQALIRIARRAVTAAAAGSAPDDTPPSLARLEECAGAFVTLYLHGQLRGCVGTFDTTRPVHQTVREMAVAASTRDTRFLPVRSGEVDDLVISISVLSPPVTVTELDEIEVGRDGLIVSQGFMRGVLLGKVAVERRWNREEFLAATCTKAGLRPDAWHTFGRPGGIELQRFETYDFGEP